MKENEEKCLKAKRRKLSELSDMEKYPSPMTEAFLRPAYDGTVLCPDPKRRQGKIKPVSPQKG